MKKVLFLALITLLVVFPVFAGGSSDKANKGNSYTVAANCEWPPFEYVDDKGQITGFEMDLINEIAKDQGFEVTILNVAWDGIFAGLQTGMYDAVASGVTITEERKQTLDFTSPFVTLKQAILVKANGPQYKNEKDLINKTVGVQNGTTGHFAVEENGIKNIKKFDAIPEAVLDLINGNLDAVVVDSVVASDYVIQNENLGSKLAISGYIENAESEDIAICTKAGNPFLTKLENGYQNLVKNGKVAELKKKYNIL